VINFDDDCVDDLNQAFKDSIEDYLAFCKQRGEEPQKPYSGKFEVRIDPEYHEKLYLRANEQGKSINKLVNEMSQAELASQKS